MNNLRATKGPFKQHRGFAIVVVLSVLVLLTILMVGFLSRTAVERTAASSYFEDAQANILAEQAVSIVQAQIDHASTQKNVTWASQPGMVRSFKTNGAILHAYKLYSDDAMVADTVDLRASLSKLDNWNSFPAHYVDLNAPVFRKPNEVDKEPIYPIVDASSADGSIEGFSVKSAPMATLEQPVPMPVMWLYVLKDGTTVAPEAPQPQQKGVATVPGATAANPIIGRIAFWTDDENSKLNINTAAHGFFWDLPRAYSLEERDRMARFQPALYEFQRYPGHPATTSLWPVFGYKFPGDNLVADSTGRFTFPKFSEFVYDLAPRVEAGGSLGGTAIAQKPVITDGERLYSSVDELLFSAHNGVRAASPSLQPSDIEKTKFFLTARSNSPEISLFNLPRMAIWPINAGAKKSSTLDKMIAFCSTINGSPYYFQREDPNSGSVDVDPTSATGSRNLQLYAYINKLLGSPIAGFPFSGTTLAGKYTPEETSQLVTEIFDYIRSSNLYSTVLGADAYTAGDPAVAASKVGQVVPLRIGATKGVGRIPNLSKAVFQLYISGARSDKGGAFVPLNGKTPEYWEGLVNPNLNPIYDRLMQFLSNTGESEDVFLKTSGIIYFDTFDPMYGYIYPRYKFDIDVEFKGAWTVDGKALGFPKNATLEIRHDHHSVYNAKSDSGVRIWMGKFLGGALGPLWMMQNYSSVPPNPTGTLFNGAYPLVSQQLELHPGFKLEKRLTPWGLTPPPGDSQVTLPASSSLPAQLISFSGGTVVAKLKVDGEVVQEYEFEFDGFTKPAPVYADRSIKLDESFQGIYWDADKALKQFAVSCDFRHRWLYQPHRHRLNYPGAGGEGDYVDLSLVQDGDVAVALEPKFGDKRLLSAKPLLTSGNGSFEKNVFYDVPTERVAVDLRVDPSGSDRRIRANRLNRKPGRILNISYGQNAMPEIQGLYKDGVEATTKGVGNSHFVPDFDNGTLHIPDDAYVNRADEGSSYDDSTSNSASFAWYLNTADKKTFYNTPTFFSPNKQMPSAVMFGSLPTGVIRNHPWQTLLFRPDPGNHPGAAGVPDYMLLDLFWMPVVEPYAISEPFSTNGKVNLNYQIMPFGYIHRSTALRGVFQAEEIVSLEDSDARSGGSDALGYGNGSGGKSPAEVRLGDSYKLFDEGDASGTDYLSNKKFRKRLNLDKDNGTFKSLEEKFSNGDIYHSEAEVCTLPLIPEGEEWSQDFEAAYWGARRLTGDNSREKPYAHLLPRLTTRSNTYTVHFRAQSLKKRVSSDQTVWDETKDTATAELRGSRVIERYIDPSDANIPDYAASTSPSDLRTLESFYRWRVIANREFSP